MIKELDLPNPVRSHYGHAFLKQYVRDHHLRRTEPANNSVYDYNVNKDIEHPHALRQKMSGMVDDFHDAQPTFWRPSWIAANSGRTHRRGQWQMQPWAEAGPPAATHRDVRPGTLRQHCGVRDFSHRGHLRPGMEALGCDESNHSLASLASTCPS